MSTLYNVTIIRNTHAMLPVVSVSVCQLVELAIRLVRDVEHALVVGKHLILLEAHRCQL